MQICTKRDDSHDKFKLIQFPNFMYGNVNISDGMEYNSTRGIHQLIHGESKRKGGQIRFSNSQTSQLEKAFMEQKYQNANDRKKLAHSLGLSDRQVKTW